MSKKWTDRNCAHGKVAFRRQLDFAYCSVPGCYESAIAGFGLAEATQWKNIESAPLTGEEILLAISTDNDLRYPIFKVGYWDRRGYWQYEGRVYSEASPELKPRRWAPIPKL